MVLESELDRPEDVSSENYFKRYLVTGIACVKFWAIPYLFSIFYWIY